MSFNRLLLADSSTNHRSFCALKNVPYNCHFSKFTVCQFLFKIGLQINGKSHNLLSGLVFCDGKSYFGRDSGKTGKNWQKLAVFLHCLLYSCFFYEIEYTYIKLLWFLRFLVVMHVPVDHLQLYNSKNCRTF